MTTQRWGPIVKILKEVAKHVGNGLSKVVSAAKAGYNAFQNAWTEIPFWIRKSAEVAASLYTIFEIIRDMF